MWEVFRISLCFSAANIECPDMLYAFANPFLINFGAKLKCTKSVTGAPPHMHEQFSVCLLLMNLPGGNLGNGTAFHVREY